MTTLRCCLDMLERYQIPYLHTTHANAYRAREVAEAEHLPPYRLAKTVILRGSNTYMMAVLPADHKIDLDELAIKLQLERLRLATEEEVRELFPDSEVGAMPPFGPLFGMPVYMDVRLAEEPYILFNAGTHRDAIHISVDDYLRLTDPAIVQFAYPEQGAALADPTTRRSYAGVQTHTFSGRFLGPMPCGRAVRDLDGQAISGSSHASACDRIPAGWYGSVEAPYPVTFDIPAMLEAGEKQLATYVAKLCDISGGQNRQTWRCCR